VRAILEATFRVLDEVGDALTTTRVAAVAGVSVGTLYQYFPNREALINGALADHLEAAIGAVEEATAAAAGLPLEVAAERVVRAVLAVKAERAPVSRVLHRVFGTGKLDDRPAVRAATRRATRAIAGLFAAGGEPSPEIVRRAELTTAALEGMVRAALEDDIERLRDPRWVEQVVSIAIRAVG